MAKDVKTQPRRTPPSPRQLSASQRRRAYNRMRRQKRRKLLFYIAAFLAVIVVAVVLCLTVLFRITAIDVEGDTRYSADDLIAACGIEPGENLFLADTKGAEAALEEKYPYLATVEVHRSLPARIEISVTDAKVSCAAAWNNQYLLLDKSGKVLEITGTPPDGTPVCTGLSVKSAALGQKVVLDDPEQLSLYAEVAGAVSESGLEPVTSIDVSDAFNLKVVCQNEAGNRMTLELGNENYLSKKLRFAKATLEQKLSDSAAGTFDLSLVTQEKSLTFFSLDPVESTPEESPSSEDPDSGTGTSSEESGGEGTASIPEDAPYFVQNGGYTYNGDGTYTDADGNVFDSSGNWLYNENY